MKAIILAGGFGTRLRPVIGDDVPKCLAPVMGKPMISYIINRMKTYGINDITLALHYKAEQFIEKFGDSVKYHVEEKPLGTGGAIKKCISGKSPVLIANGDTICPIDYADMRDKHTREVTIAVDKNGLHAGTYIINPRTMKRFTKEVMSLEKDVLPNVMFSYYRVPYFTDLGTPDTYLKAPVGWV